MLRHTDRPRLLVQSALFARGSGANPDGRFDSTGLGLERANWATGIQVVLPNLFDAPSLRARRAAAAAGTNDAQAVIRKLKEKPIDDPLFGPVVVRADGRAIHNMYIFKAKAPKASTGKWDLLEKIGVLTGPEAFRPLDQGGCAMVEQHKGN